MYSKLNTKSALLVGLFFAFSPGCADDAASPAAPSPTPNEQLSPATWEIERAFPTEDAPGFEFHGCIFSSPMKFSGTTGTEILVLGDEGLLAGLDPETGDKLWQLTLPRPDGEGVLSIAQP